MSELSEKEKSLELLRIEKEIATEKAEIAQRHAVEREMKQKHGKSWRKLLGIHPKKDVLQDMYAISPDLRNLSLPPRRLG